MDNFWVIIILLVVIPLFFWYRVKSINKVKRGVTVRCPSCAHDQRLDKLQNYSCTKCEKQVVFYKEDGTTVDNLEMYKCLACGAINFKGVITCTECGLANQSAFSNI